MTYVRFAEEFEKRFVSQGEFEDRNITGTLELGWELLSILPKAELKRVHKEFLEKYGKA